jgi:hypothetical protein
MNNKTDISLMFSSLQISRIRHVCVTVCKMLNITLSGTQWHCVRIRFRGNLPPARKLKYRIQGKDVAILKRAFCKEGK